jgi:hypothetical protein
MILSICFFCTVGFYKGQAQAAYCSGNNRSGSCYSSGSAPGGGYNDAIDLWEMTAPTGILQYSMSIDISDNQSYAQSIFWGDGPMVNIYTIGTDPSTWYQTASGTITGLSTTQVLDIEEEVMTYKSGSANLSATTW